MTKEPDYVQPPKKQAINAQGYVKPYPKSQSVQPSMQDCAGTKACN